MSQKKRLAKLTQRLTGMPLTAALRLAYDGGTFFAQPVPDAASPAQRAFETRLVYALVDEFPEREEMRGYPWAIQAVSPRHDGLDIYPAPGMQQRLLAALLPRLDRLYGGIRGADGARAARIDPGWWTLYDVDSPASVRVAAPWECDPYRGADPHEPTRALPRPVTSPNRTRAERRERRTDQDHGTGQPAAWLAHRNLMCSRLLRRPYLTRWVATTHGCVNIYTHARLDVAIEWCCTPSLEALLGLVERSGLTAPTVDLHLPPSAAPHPDTHLSRRGTVRIGHAKLYLTRNQWHTEGQLLPRFPMVG